MSKLPDDKRFLDLSDYGRPLAKRIALGLQNTSFTPVHLTLAFVLCGLMAVICILLHYFWAAIFFLILKSVLDAADGELARVKNTPSYTGRFLDSVSDIILNILILISIWYITNGSELYALLAFVGLQLQGTLYNYYYAILKNRYDGDTTSRIFETDIPSAMQGENQRHVTVLFRLYQVFYGFFDQIIYALDRGASYSKTLPNWLMTAVSTFGLGFQLLLIGVMLVLQLEDYILRFFIVYSFLIFVFIAIRRYINR